MIIMQVLILTTVLDFYESNTVKNNSSKSNWGGPGLDLKRFWLQIIEDKLGTGV